MTQNIQNLFKNLKNIEPSTGLEGKILRKYSLGKNGGRRKG